MAATVVNSAGAIESPPTSGNTNTRGFTVSANANRLVLVGLRAANAPSSVTFGGAAPTATFGPQITTYLYAFVAPPSGAQNLVAAFSTYTSMDYFIVEFAGVDQTTPLGTYAVQNTANPATIILTPSMTCPVDGLLFGLMSTTNVAAGSPTAATGCTLLYSARSGATSWTFGAAYRSDSGAVGMVVAGNTANPAPGLGLPINPVAVSDTTAPVLSSPVGTQTGSSTATVGATTDEGNGTLYAVVTTSATQPSVAQIKAGQNDGGTAAVWAGTLAISSTGAKTLNATGLTASTAYYAHVVHADAAGNNSNRVSSASFTTAAPTRTITLTLTAADGTTPRASLTGLKWAVWEVATPDLITAAPVAKGAAETTDGTGVLVITYASGQSAGAVVYLVVTDSNGVPTQSPAPKAFAGPVELT